MLEFLKIQNLALLDEAQIDFHSGFTVLTGETGAGKSVLLGALSMLAGNRAGKEVVKKDRDSCTIEAVLNFKDSSEIDAFLESEDLPPCEDGALVLRRSVHSQKAGKCAINGSLATAATLQKLGEFWVDFHGPGEPQKLFNAKNQLSMLDAFSSNKPERLRYLELLNERKQTLTKIDELKNAKQMSVDEIDFTRAQIAAIDALNPSEESVAKLEADFKLMESSREIIEKTFAASELISGDEGAMEKLSQALRLTSDISGASGDARALAERLNATLIELEDVSESLAGLGQNSAFSEEEAAELRANMDAWLTLRRKYGGAEKVLEARAAMLARIENQGNVKEAVEKLLRRVSDLETETTPLAKKIFDARKKSAQKLAEKVEGLLKRLGFKSPKFQIKLEEISEFSYACGSVCEFEFSANPGQDCLPLAKVASSGELARVMLAIKTAMAEAEATPLLVFDEVDANIGGETGIEVGKELSKLADRHQVFCVTHLPQVAAFGHRHLFVEKTHSADGTSVTISELDPSGKERIREIARMLGDRNSPSAAKHATELLSVAAKK